MKPQKYQIWKDNTPNARFFIISREADAFGYVEIITVERSENRLSLPKSIERGRIDYARQDRFDGMAGNYTYVAKNLKTFNDNLLGVIHFALRLPRNLRLMERSAPVLDLGTITVVPVPETGPIAGEIWREVKGSYARYVQVIGEKANGKVQILTRYFTDLPGHRPMAINDAKATFAQEGRFNGKPGGYEFVSRNLTELVESGEVFKRFVPAGETLGDVLKQAFPNLTEGQVWHEAGNTACFHLVKIVGINEDEIEISTSYVATQDEKVAASMPIGMSVIIPIDEFAANAQRFNLVAAA